MFIHRGAGRLRGGLLRKKRCPTGASSVETPRWGVSFDLSKTTSTWQRDLQTFR